MNFLLPEESYHKLERIVSRIRLLTALAQGCHGKQITISAADLDDTLLDIHHDISAALDTAQKVRS